MVSYRRVLVSIVILTLSLTACSASTSPQQIAVYPKDAPIAIAPHPSVVIVYRAYLEIIVTDVEKAADRAVQYAYDYSGYLAGSQSWYTDGRKITTIVLAVPTANFHGLRQTLLGLGHLVSENISGEPAEPHYGEAWKEYSYITLQLRPSAARIPAFPISSWDPGRTLQRALSVSIAILGFLADILIWVIVVVGPFILIGWLGWLAWKSSKRWRKPIV